MNYADARADLKMASRRIGEYREFGTPTASLRIALTDGFVDVSVWPADRQSDQAPARLDVSIGGQWIERDVKVEYLFRMGLLKERRYLGGLFFTSPDVQYIGAVNNVLVMYTGCSHIEVEEMGSVRIEQRGSPS